MGALTSVAGRAVSGGSGLTRADALAAEAAMDALRQLLAPGTPSSSPSVSPQVPHSCSATARGRCPDIQHAQRPAHQATTTTRILRTQCVSGGSWYLGQPPGVWLATRS